MEWFFRTQDKALIPSPGSIFDMKFDEDQMRKLVKKNRRSLINTMQKDPKAFYHISLDPIPKLKMNPKKVVVSILRNENYFNPTGLWISEGPAWIEWLPRSYPNIWNMATYIYKVVPSSTVLRIHNKGQFLKFVSKYKNKRCKTVNCVIDWARVAKDWDGLIIAPYLGQQLLGKDASYIQWDGHPQLVTNFYKKIFRKDYDKNPAYLSQWYRHWEIPSGVIWNERGVQTFQLVKKLNTFDHLYSNWNVFKEWFKNFLNSIKIA